MHVYCKITSCFLPSVGLTQALPLFPHLSCSSQQDRITTLLCLDPSRFGVYSCYILGKAGKLFWGESFNNLSKKK